MSIPETPDSNPNGSSSRDPRALARELLAHYPHGLPGEREQLVTEFMNRGGMNHHDAVQTAEALSKAGHAHHLPGESSRWMFTSESVPMRDLMTQIDEKLRRLRGRVGRAARPDAGLYRLALGYRPRGCRRGLGRPRARRLRLGRPSPRITARPDDGRLPRGFSHGGVRKTGRSLFVFGFTNDERPRTKNVFQRYTRHYARTRLVRNHPLRRHSKR